MNVENKGYQTRRIQTESTIANHELETMYGDKWQNANSGS